MHSHSGGLTSANGSMIIGESRLRVDTGTLYSILLPMAPLIRVWDLLPKPGWCKDMNRHQGRDRGKMLQVTDSHTNEERIESPHLE